MVPSREAKKEQAALEPPELVPAEAIAPPAAPEDPAPTRNVWPVAEANRPHELACKLDNARDQGLRPIVVLFVDPASSLDPADRPDALFIDLSGHHAPAASNVRPISSRVFLEMVLVHTRRAIDRGAKHLLIDDVATMEFFCGEGATQEFLHSMSNMLRIAGAGWDLLVTDEPRTAALRANLKQWLI